MKKNKTFFTLGGHDRDGGTTNGSGDSKQTTSTRDRGDSIIGVYWWQTLYEEKRYQGRFEKMKVVIYEYESKKWLNTKITLNMALCS